MENEPQTTWEIEMLNTIRRWLKEGAIISAIDPDGAVLVYDPKTGKVHGGMNVVNAKSDINFDA